MSEGIKYIKAIIEGKTAETGIPSLCSSNEYVLKAALEYAKEHDKLVLLEATANQVNQYGGYTGMKPADFKKYVYELADNIGCEREKIILGGDHLGPVAFLHLPEKDAMREAQTLIQEFVSAGFEKIHIDTSMRLLGDAKDAALPDKTIAQRGARLCEAAEKTYEERFGRKSEVLYVLGSEVPVPGGTGAEDEELSVTSAEDFKSTYYAFEKEFENNGLEKAFERVKAFVVQPGVEFGAEEVHEYDGEKAASLMRCLNEYPGIAFEGHSTDYQTYGCLNRMARDGVRILKVGPELTFSLREALFALDMINKQTSSGEGFAEAVEAAMTENPVYWEKYYRGKKAQQKLMRKFSYSDRWRYYAGDAAVKEAVNALFESIDAKQIPLPLISQFLPKQYEMIRNRGVTMSAEELAKEHIKLVIDKYYRAVSGANQ